MDDEKRNAGEERRSEGEQRESAGSAFLRELQKFFAVHELQASFRTTSQGLFISEDVLERFLESYRQWLREKTGAAGEKSIQKCKRRLFETEDLKLYYLLDGKRCLSGYLMPAPGAKHQTIAHYGANLLDTAEYVHPRDTRLAALPGVESELRQHEGLVFVLRTSSGEIVVSADALVRFARAARTQEHLLVQHPGLRGPLRDCVAPLGDVLKKGRPIGRKDRVLIPLRYRNQDVLMRRSGALVFLLSDVNAVLDCYAVAGKGLGVFVQSEVEQLRSSGRGIKGIEILKKGSSAARFALQKHTFTIEQRALSRFASALHRAHVSKNILPMQFTLIDALQTFVLFFSSAKPVHETRKQPSELQRRADLKFRRTGPWIFGFDRNNVIRSCMQTTGTQAAGPEDGGRHGGGGGRKHEQGPPAARRDSRQRHERRTGPPQGASGRRRRQRRGK